MIDDDLITSFEKRPRKNYRPFSSSSLIELWPALHRNPVIWVALIINSLASLLSVYASSLLDQNTNVYNYALLILLVTTFSTFAIFVSESIENWIHVIEENTVRRLLLKPSVKNASLANIDLPLAVYTISFYVAVPAQLASLVVYAGYISYRSPGSIAILLGVMILFAYPVYRFAIWRRTMIRVIRHYRNHLVDGFGEDPAQYKIAVEKYAHTETEYFWRNIQALIVLRITVFAVLLLALKLNQFGDHSFSVLVAMMLLLTEGHRLFNAACEFQEDKVSLARVKSALNQ